MMISTGRILFALLLISIVSFSYGQNTLVTPRPLTMEEYQKVKTFDINDLDNDSYVKIENTFILDRYEMRKPYFITGDDGLRKRIDLYKLIAKDNMDELGLMIFYTNEKGTKYKACMPNFTADGKVWEHYFEDIHAIDKVEKNFVLKLSYVLSKEMGYQLYKAVNQGQDLSKESVTYGNDICFPGNQLVTLASGVSKYLREVNPGDKVVTIDAAGNKTITLVKELVEHETKNYAITRLVAMLATEKLTTNAVEVSLSVKQLEATPNHPVPTIAGTKPTGSIMEGEQVLCFHPESGKQDVYTVISKEEFAGGFQKVYNIVTADGDTFIMNDILVNNK